MVRPKIEIGDVLLSITKNCETLIKQIHTRLEETLEFKFNKSIETFLFNPTTSYGGSWMIGLITLEVNNSIFNITEENIIFEVYTDNFDEFSFEELKDKHDEILNISHITLQHLQHEKMGLLIIGAYRK